MMDEIRNTTPLENKPRNNIFFYIIIATLSLFTVITSLYLVLKTRTNYSEIDTKLKSELKKIFPTINLYSNDLNPTPLKVINKDCNPPFFEKCEVDTYNCTTTDEYKNQILKGIIVEDNYLSDKQIKNRTKYCHTPDLQDDQFLHKWNQEGCYELENDKYTKNGAGWNFAGNYPLCFAQKTPDYYFADYVYSKEQIASIEAGIKNQHWIAFKSKLFNFSFQYPSKWGETKEIFDVDKSAYSGKSYMLTFSKNSKIMGFGISKDYSAGRGGGVSPFTEIEPVASPSIRHMIDIQDPDCFTMGSRNSFSGVININLPNSDLKNGITFLLPILSDEDRERIQWKFLVNREALNCEQEKDETLSKEKAKRILTYIETAKKVDNESLLNIITFDQFIQGLNINK